MTTYEIHGDRSLLYDVSEVSFHLRMGKKRTENYLHYLWLEKIIIPVRYRKIGSEPYWEKSSIDSLLKISKEEWDGLKIPEFDPKKNYKSMILKFPISKTKNTIPMKNKSSVKKGLYNKGEAAKRLGYSSTTSGYRYIDYLVENKFLRAIKLEGIRAPRFRVEEVEALLNKEDELGLPISKTKNSILMKNNNTYHAINCRIRKDVYENLQEILEITQKNTAITVADSITHYVNCVVGKTEKLHALEVDKFAWELSRKKK